MAEIRRLPDLDGVLLVRHGETDDNIEPIRAQGFADTPLNATGRAQAAQRADQLASNGQAFSSLWSSDLSRAHETAKIIGSRVGLEPTLDPRLREGDRGRWEGHRFIDIKRSEPELYAAWMRGGPEFRFPGGESLVEQQERVIASLLDIHATGELPALVVCHGGCIRVVLSAGDPRGLDAFHDFDVPNVAVVPL